MNADFAALLGGELAALSIEGRDAAFAEIMRRHRDSVYRIVLGNVGDGDEALDMTQETFVSAHAALLRYDPARPMRAWLARIAINKCRDWARRRAVRRFFSFGLTPEHADAVASADPDPEVAAAERQQIDRLAKAIADLPASLREPLVLCSLDGMAQADAAAVLGVTPKAVETRIRRARLRLAEVLSDG